MSDKIDEQIDKAFKKKAALALDNMLENLISEAIKEKGLTFDAAEDDDVLMEALDAYAKKSSTSGLLKEQDSSNAEEAVRQFLASLPKMEVSERWGDPGSHTRAEIKRFTENIKGKTIQDKFHNLMQIQSPKSRITSASRVIASLVLLESLKGMIVYANASSAGFAFEGFLAALMNGHQVSDPTDGSLPIEDVMLFTFEDVATTATKPGDPVSLKMLTEKGVVKGSYTNMIDGLYRPEFKGKVTYVVAYKINQGEADFHIRISENVITQQNLYSVLTHKNAKSSNAQLFDLDPRRVEVLKSYPKVAQHLPAYTENWPAKLNEKANTITYALLQATKGYSVDKFNAKFPPKDNLASKQKIDPVAQKKLANKKAAQKQSAVKPKAQKQQQLSEAKGGDGGSQWEINSTFFTSENVNIIGEIQLSEEAIFKTAMQYSDILKQSVAQVFQAVGALGVHVNQYFVGKNRDAAVKSGKEAIEDTKKIAQGLSEEIASSEQ